MYNTASDSCMCSAAVNYPIRLLSRQCNPFTTEILAYINGAPQKIIVLSDLDEHIAFTAGNAFYEKGVDNIFIVSGGIASVWPVPHLTILQLRMKSNSCQTDTACLFYTEPTQTNDMSCMIIKAYAYLTQEQRHGSSKYLTRQRNGTSHARSPWAQAKKVLCSTEFSHLHIPSIRLRPVGWRRGSTALT